MIPVRFNQRFQRRIEGLRGQGVLSVLGIAAWTTSKAVSHRPLPARYLASNRERWQARPVQDAAGRGSL